MNMISRRKFMAVAGAAAAVSVLTACGSSSSTASSTATSSSTASSAASGEAAEGTAVSYVALCCDTGTIDDESFNQACWTAVQNYMGDNCQYYIPEADASDEDRETMIRQAVNDGADTVVCVGYLYGASLAWAAEQYPDTRFIAIDVTQADIGTDTIPANCYCITFKEEQAGYLAGYAIAKDGFTKLGFLGGMAVPAVIRYGYGYIQGIDAAAQETGNAVEVNYYYGGQFYGDANITSRMEGWYTSGTEVIFGCGGSVGNSVMAAAEASSGKVIGVDVDQSSESDTVISSAMKGLSSAVEQMLDHYYNDSFPGGQNLTLGAADNAVELPMATSKWNNFTQEDYDTLFSKLASGEITLKKDTDAEIPTDLGCANVTLNYIAE